MSEQPPADADTTEAAASLETVEAVVRRQLATALGGRRGMIEAAVPTLLFTVTWLTQRDLTLALMISVAAALVLLVVRLVQRSTPQLNHTGELKPAFCVSIRCASSARKFSPSSFVAK